MKSARGKRESCKTRSSRNMRVVFHTGSSNLNLFLEGTLIERKTDFVTLNQPLLCLWLFQGAITRSTEMSMKNGLRWYSENSQLSTALALYGIRHNAEEYQQGIVKSRSKKRTHDYIFRI